MLPGALPEKTAKFPGSIVTVQAGRFSAAVKVVTEWIKDFGKMRKKNLSEKGKRGIIGKR